MPINIKVAFPADKDINMKSSHRLCQQIGLTLCWGMLITVACLAPITTRGQDSMAQPTGITVQHLGTHHVPSPDEIPNEARAMINHDPQLMSYKQKASIVQANFDKSKNDAAELATLARDLRAELEKPDANALSFDIATRIDKIEKLAKKIRDETKIY